ncbi:hypothetical protein [Enterovibrio norvegicus]
MEFLEQSNKKEGQGNKKEKPKQGASVLSFAWQAAFCRRFVRG